MELTARSLLGRRRSLLLFALPALALALAALVRYTAEGSAIASSSLTQNFSLGVLVPLVSLLVATGVIGAEIDDGAIVYMLAKPVKRWVILVSKLVVAWAAVIAFAVLPTMAAVVIAGDDGGRLSLAFGLTALAAGLVYTAIFVALGILTRNAVIVGLLYALLWESVLGGYVPGIRTVSVRQWALSVGEEVLGGRASQFDVVADVSLGLGVTLMVAVTAVAIWLGARKLSTLTLSAVE